MLPFKFTVFYNKDVKFFAQNDPKMFPFYFGLFGNDNENITMACALQKSFLEVVAFQKKKNKGEITLEVTNLHQKLDLAVRPTNCVWIRSQSMDGFHFSVMEIKRQQCLKRKRPEDGNERGIVTKQFVQQPRPNFIYHPINWNHSPMNFNLNFVPSRPNPSQIPTRSFWPVLTPNMQRMWLASSQQI